MKELAMALIVVAEVMMTPLSSEDCLQMVMLEVGEMLFVRLFLMMTLLVVLHLMALDHYGFQNRSWMMNYPRMSGYCRNVGRHSVCRHPCNSHYTYNHLHNGIVHMMHRSGSSGDSDYNHTSKDHFDTTTEYYYRRTRVVDSMNRSTEDMGDRTYHVPIHRFLCPG
jgi:hypothetical protein